MKQAAILFAGTSLLAATAASAQNAATPPAQEIFSTGVAKGRDRLDSATSTSALRAAEAEKLGPRPIADILRTIPGIRVESGIGEGNANYTVRGLPLAAGGSKYMQIQEDGLPALEFGDIFNVAGDVFLRADYNTAAIESIRGGSASTFASNSPGGVVNLISKTGETEGGAVQLTGGLDYDEKRVDADYGKRLGDGWRFHIGGHYRVGEGPRRVGFDGWKGGQIRANITKELSNGYIRVHLKYLKDRSPTFAPYPVRITGTNDKPEISNFPGFDIRRDSYLSPHVGSVVTLNGDNQLASFPLQRGMQPISKAIGLEAQFDLGGWTISERMRFQANSGDFLRVFPSTVNTVAALSAAQAGAGATATYATGPNAGQPVTADANGNGLISFNYMAQTRARSLDNFTNDLRATRVWKVGGGNLTTTAGIYEAIQDLDVQWLHSAIDTDVAGDGNTAMVNVRSATGGPQTLDGYYAFSRNGSNFRRIFDVKYGIIAPYGSVNYHIGKVAVGGSLRWDVGRVRGQLFGADLGGGRTGIRSQDINGDGIITAPETRVAFLPLDRPAPVNYNYDYLSYSAGVNYRVAEPFSLFARYSRGARANADKILFTPAVSSTTGDVADPTDKYDEVRQLEGGFKFRKAGATLNATAFRADADDHNVLNGAATRTVRTYRAYGVELEGGYRYGPFSIAAGATYTTAEITQDKLDATLTGKDPRHQPKWVLQATPQIETKAITVGASIVTLTGSYAQDNNVLRMPGFTTVGAFAQVRVTDRTQVMLNATNLFDTIGIFEISQGTLPANGIAWARSINGRTVSASLRYNL